MNSHWSKKKLKKLTYETNTLITHVKESRITLYKTFEQCIESPGCPFLLLFAASSQVYINWNIIPQQTFIPSKNKTTLTIQNPKFQRLLLPFLFILFF